MKLPRGWNVNERCKHDLSSAVFAWGFAKAKAKSLGLPWKVSVRVGCSKHTSWWRGRAFGSKGKGRIKCELNHTLPIIESNDHRFKNQPYYLLWGAQETICFLFAHEFGHIIGWDGSKVGEMACNKFGFEAVQAWRARQYVHPACLI